MDTKNLKIDKVKTEDIETLCSIAVDAWEKIHDGYCKYIGDDDLYGRISIDWREKKAESIRSRAVNDPENVLVAKDSDGKIVGFATFLIDEAAGLGEVGNNAVAPEFQGKGIGKLLYKHVIDIFRQKNLVYATVTTGYEDEGHASARAAYEKSGFKKMRTSITYSIKL